MVDNTVVPMAWDEPGEGKGKRPDPWGKGNDGPPDLDQVFKKFQEKFNGKFGKKGGGSNTGNPGECPGAISLGNGLIFSIIVVLYLISGFYIVKPAEQAVITRFGKYNRTVGSGPHWYPKFIEQKYIINTEELLSTRQAGTMLTKDENLVSVEIQVQYRVSDVNNYLFKVIDPEKSLRQAAESALRQAVGHNKLDFIITSGRLEIEEQTKKQIIETLDSYNAGIYIAAVTLKEAKAPEQVKSSFDDVTKAREDRERFIHEAEAYYNKVVPEANGSAQKILREAEAYKQEVINKANGDAKRFSLVVSEYKRAPSITKTRLYLDALEEVFNNSSKVLVDLNSGNNLVYLPIDRLMQQSNKSKVDLNASDMHAISEDVKKQLRDRDDTTTARTYDRRRGS